MLRLVFMLMLASCLSPHGRLLPKIWTLAGGAWRAPRHLIQRFSRNFQQRCDRWGRPEPHKMEAILRDAAAIALRQYPQGSSIYAGGRRWRCWNLDVS